MEKRSSILVTGGAGFIGSHMVDRLIKNNWDVTVIDNLSTGEKKYINHRSDFIQGDILNKQLIKNAFKKKFDAVFHIAGCASSINSFNDPEKDILTNFLGTVNIVSSCLDTGVPRLLYASSMTVYGKVDKLPISEETLCKPISYYGISKYASERFIHATGERIDLKKPFHATSFRMFNVYGPRQSLTNPYQGVMAIFIGNTQRNEPITIFGDGNQSRDFIYIDDVVDIWTSTIENKKTFGNVYNVGYGKDISVNELTRSIIKVLGKNPKTYPISYKTARPGDQRHMRADISSVCSDLKWKPKNPLEKGLSSTIAWAQQSQIK
jgi:UDP-glucose 4-epimerase